MVDDGRKASVNLLCSEEGEAREELVALVGENVECFDEVLLAEQLQQRHEASETTAERARSFRGAQRGAPAAAARSEDCTATRVALVNTGVGTYVFCFDECLLLLLLLARLSGRPCIERDGARRTGTVGADGPADLMSKAEAGR